eukprot:gnl/MRDRNA2_/MRDRNA2_33831_c0_seq1.p1 gnl/MRDRNA2_/MRDRNA2_33831_c0~~gnl/MRDRNA2_/MRDRNA2_33831_c0_seq1.p1  ORF type:complete len:511 (-),score=104.34 gnl/MRDRNA2_/MRDRNA2_33831_c0_seq1:356-1888(-)
MLRARLAVILYSALAHRPLLDVPSCAPAYSTPSNALHVPDISISWAMNALQTCDANVNALWLSWTAVAKNMSIYIGVGVPTMKRFELIRSDYLVVGPGLPALSDEDKAQIPEDILNQVAEIPHSSGFGYWYNRAPDDQSTCDHMCDEMKKHTAVRMGRCDFYEPFTDTHSWRLVEGDEVYGPNVGSTYYVAVWLRPWTSGKFGVAIGTWKEDFFTKYDLESKELCDKATKDYDEKETMAKDDPVQFEQCTSTPQNISWAATWEGPDECGTCGKTTCGCNKTATSEESACPAGEVLASIVGSANYGATEDQCVQMCAMQNTLQWMAGVEEGSCADHGYGMMVEKKEVTPPGSPMPVAVTIMGKGEMVSCKAGEVIASIVGSEAYGATEEQCAQMCAQQSTLQWMAGVSEGTCAEQGYGAMVTQKDVTPPGSPMAVSVTIMSATGGTNYASNGSPASPSPPPSSSAPPSTTASDGSASGTAAADSAVSIAAGSSILHGAIFASVVLLGLISQ